METRWRNRSVSRLHVKLRVDKQKPLLSSQEAMLQEEVQYMYSIKVIQQLAACQGDGFCLCEGSAGLPVMLCSDAFVGMVGIDGTQVVQSGLIEILSSIVIDPPVAGIEGAASDTTATRWREATSESPLPDAEAAEAVAGLTLEQAMRLTLILPFNLTP